MTFEIQIKNGQPIIDEKAAAMFKEARKLDIKMKKLEIEMAQFKAALMDAMRENGVKSVDTDFMKAVYVPEHAQDRLDTKALKAEHPKIAAKYMKPCVVKESLRMSYK